MTFPKFDGSEALAWLARANQYFLVNKTPSDRRVNVAMLSIDGPAKPWKQLLVHCCPSLSWDSFVHELIKRFGDSDAWEPKHPATHTPPSATQPMIEPSQHKDAEALAALHAAADSAAISSLFPSAAMASTNPHDEVPFAALSAASNEQQLPSPPPPPHRQDVPLLVVPPSAVAPAPLLHSSPPPQPQPQFATTPKLSSAPMPPPLPQQQFFPAQSSPDVQHPPPQKLLFPLPRSYPLSSSQQPRPTAFRLLVQLGEYGIPHPCCLPKFSLLALLGLQWFYTLPRVHKLEFEPPPNLSCANSIAALRARLFRQWDN